MNRNVTQVPVASSVKKLSFSLSWPGKVVPGRISAPKSGADVNREDIKPSSNRIVFSGDNKIIATSLLRSLRGKVSLIYADPPYGVGTFFHSGRRGEEKAREKAYFDSSGVAEVQSFFELLFLFRELLSEEGTLWVQCDWRRSAIFRLLMDEVFGAEFFLNHVIWSYKTGGNASDRRFARKHDDILVYAKGPKSYLKPHRQKSYVPTLPEPHTPSGKRLGVKRDGICELCGNGSPGQKFRWVVGRDVWDDIPALYRNDREIVGYETQKPTALLKRIIECGTKKNALVLDLFAGSGTTAVAAEELGRRWIVGDRGAESLKVMKKRLPREVKDPRFVGV